MASTQTTFLFLLTLWIKGEFVVSIPVRIAEDKEGPHKAFLDFKEWTKGFKLEKEVSIVTKDGEVEAVFSKGDVVLIFSLKRKGLDQCECCGKQRPSKRSKCPVCAEWEPTPKGKPADLADFLSKL